MTQAEGRIALVAGGSGLVGAQLLPCLLQAPEYARVLAVSRRPLPLSHPRLANRVLRFDAPLLPQLKGVVCQEAFCCLGTTRRAAGSDAAFHAIDHDLIVQFARTAQALGATRLVLVSSVGADAGSRNLYLRTKGQTERDLETLRLPALDILRPSLLLGERREQRLAELAAQLLLWGIGPLLIGRAARFHAVTAASLAAAMRGAARAGRLGVTRYQYPDFARLAALTRPAVAA